MRQPQPMSAPGQGLMAEHFPDAPEPGGEAASDEEQTAFDEAVNAIGKVIYDEEGSKQILEMVRAAADPLSGIADAAVMLVENEDQRQDGAIPDTMIIPIAADIAERVAEIVNESGLAQVDEQALQAIGQGVIAELADDYGQEPADMVEALGPEMRQAGIEIPPDAMRRQGQPAGGQPPPGGPRPQMQ